MTLEVAFALSLNLVDRIVSSLCFFSSKLFSTQEAQLKGGDKPAGRTGRRKTQRKKRKETDEETELVALGDVGDLLERAP